ncbi:MAG TPA: biotin/lipoyl-binding protein [Candidatus Omnitrophota bacterium]|nr:biotin/lipoyl-binding protein [Candidatus Omnitrophota bacterium]HPN88136.1 biotin/lipoyl-binding protein [Candidatus Omnitrophota bacterium]
MKNIVLPDLGEGIENGIISAIYVQEGDWIKDGDDIVELVTDKAAFNVPSTCSGKIKKINVRQGQEIFIGEILLILE